jgi:cytochrome c553
MIPIKKNSRLLNILFVVLAAAVLFFLSRAPEETTSRLPSDDIHKEFHLIKSKKEADSHCSKCHSAEGEAPLPADHPPPYRCLFCHKRN